MSLIYEVNVEVEKEIFQEYIKWLKEKHFGELLKVDGFQTATLYFVEGTESSVSCQYKVENREKLENYFNNEAKAMRQDGIDRFGTKFKATRRVLTLSM